MWSCDVGQDSVVERSMVRAMSHPMIGPVSRKMAERPCDGAERCLRDGVAGYWHLVLDVLFRLRQQLGPRDRAAQ